MWVNREKSNFFFSELEAIRAWSSWPWNLGGDFNIVRFPEERRGGCCMSRGMKLFDDFVRRQNLVDLPLNGALFTYSVGSVDLSMSRLDRFLMEAGWNHHFGITAEIPLYRFNSDHRAILLKGDERVRGPFPFHFELMWFQHPNLME
ncbi:hypothetical protein FRX31_032829 [Thalictrum thalictroides]|uniref:Uncharacterized protein n=1 Tax=Thalictrum thalictroides TaxID=46969 RepID=A0A7J6UZY5_THATH|nr:hypothetical protein FRX31_032829 [Thalictrum thalictroides]